MKKITNWVKLLGGAALVTTLGVGTVACSSQNKTSNEQSSQTSTHSSSKTSTTASHTTQSSNIKVSQSEAVAKFNKKFANSKIKAIDLQADGSKYIYQIEGFDSKSEHELTIDAETGKEIHTHSENLDLDERHQTGLDLDKVISRTEASKIAESRAKGTAIEWNLELDDGQPIWDVTVKNGRHHTEVKINAETKHVIESEYDD